MVIHTLPFSIISLICSNIIFKFDICSRCKDDFSCYRFKILDHGRDDFETTIN